MWICMCVSAPGAAEEEEEEEEEEEGGAFLFDETGSVLELLRAALAVVQQAGINTVEQSVNQCIRGEEKRSIQNSRSQIEEKG